MSPARLTPNVSFSSASMRQVLLPAKDFFLAQAGAEGMDGMEVIKAFRNVRADVPIIAISGGGLMPTELLLSTAKALGAVEVVSKPFEVAQLIGPVERALAPDED